MLWNRHWEQSELSADQQRRTRQVPSRTCVSDHDHVRGRENGHAHVRDRANAGSEMMALSALKYSMTALDRSDSRHGNERGCRGHDCGRGDYESDHDGDDDGLLTARDISGTGHRRTEPTEAEAHRLTSHGKHAEQIDAKTHARDDEELQSVVHLWRMHDPLDRLEHNEDRDEDEEDAVGKPTQGFYARIAKSERRIRLPRSHDGGEETHPNGGTVEEHVYGIGNEAQAVRPHSPE